MAGRWFLYGDHIPGQMMDNKEDFDHTFPSERPLLLVKAGAILLLFSRSYIHGR